jgi:hypothetical protein
VCSLANRCRLSEGGAAFVVDAAWQQYPFVAKMEKVLRIHA